MGEIKKISEMIDIDLLQTLQDNCSKAMGIGVVTVDYRGNPVTRYSGFTKHCMKVREVQGLSEMCAQCDAHGGLHAAITGQPYIYRCHADLVDFAVPLIIDNCYMGAVLGGQVRMCDEEEHQLEHILPQQSNWRKNQEINELYEQMEMVSYEKVEAAVHILRDVIVTMTKMDGSQSVQDALLEKDRQLIEERATRSELELAIQKQEADAANRLSGFRYFFFVMNIISRLAYEEKAEQTEVVAYDFADMMRYVTGTVKNISTLGEELSYVGSMLRIQKAWVRDKLDFLISIPERYWGISCPFMLLQPIVEKMLEGIGGSSQKPLKIDFYAEEEGEALLLQVLSDNTAQTIREWEILLNSSEGEGEYSLCAANNTLKRMFGNEFGLTAGARRDGRGGVALRFQLPLEKKG